MQELLKTVQDVVDNAGKLGTAMRNAVVRANDLIKKSEAGLIVASEKEVANEAKARDLSTREEEVSKVEDVLAIAENGRLLAIENKDAQAKIDKNAAAFESYRRSKLQELSAITKKNEAKEAEIDSAWKSIAKKEAELSREQEGFVARLLAKVGELEKK